MQENFKEETLEEKVVQLEEENRRLKEELIKTTHALQKAAGLPPTDFGNIK